MRAPALALLFPLLFASFACGESPAAKTPATPAAPAWMVTPLPLPGAEGPLALDYLGMDRAKGKLWVPAAGTGSVDVVDVRTKELVRIEGFATQEREIRGKKRKIGPSSVTFGDGMVYVGNRGASEICAIDPKTNTKGECLHLEASPDGIAYVAATKEVFVTNPEQKQLTILDASSPAKLAMRTTMTLDGEPEGYAVDEKAGRFYTNLEDTDRTLAIDAKGRSVLATWEPHCGKEGPRGLALDVARGHLFVACTNKVEVLDTAHGGATLGTFDTGAGVDNIDYVEPSHRLFVVSGAKASAYVLESDPAGALHLVATAPTAPGTRVIVAAEDGSAFAADPQQGRILAISAPR